MRAFAALALILSLTTSVHAEAPSPHAARMKTCAAEWQAKKRTKPERNVRYQKFMSDCMKSQATNLKSQPAPAAHR